MTKLVYSTDGEMYDIDSVEELIDQMKDQTTYEGDNIIGLEYFVAEASPCNVKFIYDFDDLVDTIYDRLSDEVGECSESLDITGREEYNMFMEGFLERNSNLKSFYILRNLQEKTITKEDLNIS